MARGTVMQKRSSSIMKVIVETHNGTQTVEEYSVEARLPKEALEKAIAIEIGKEFPEKPSLASIVQLMEANIEEPLTIEDIASCCGISTRQIERIFQKFFGMFPRKYYMGLRMERAQYLLQETNCSVAEVGAKCGFPNSSAFSKSYNRFTGRWPQQERQKKGER